MASRRHSELLAPSWSPVTQAYAGALRRDALPAQSAAVLQKVAQTVQGSTAVVQGMRTLRAGRAQARDLG